jgi:putative tricarboxylic transport membrane protein
MQCDDGDHDWCHDDLQHCAGAAGDHKQPRGVLGFDCVHVVGNLMLIVLNLPLIGIWVKLLSIPYRWLFPAIVLFCAIGAYSTSYATWDIWMLSFFGVLGYLFIRLGMEPAPLMLGYILGPMMEETLRRALVLSNGHWSVFVTRGLSASLLAVAAVLLIVVLLPSIKKKREVVFRED